MKSQPQFSTDTNTLKIHSTGLRIVHEKNNGIYDVMLNFSFLKASDSFSHSPFCVSAACPLFQFAVHNKTEYLPTSSIFVQR